MLNSPLDEFAFAILYCSMLRAVLPRILIKLDCIGCLTTFNNADGFVVISFLTAKMLRSGGDNVHGRVCLLQRGVFEFAISSYPCL